MSEQRHLVRSHSLLGYEVGQVPSPDAPEKPMVVVQTRPYLAGESLRTVPAHMVAEATERDVKVLLHAHLVEAFELARFLGASPETINQVITNALADQGIEPAKPAKPARRSKKQV